MIGRILWRAAGVLTILIFLIAQTVAIFFVPSQWDARMEIWEGYGESIYAMIFEGKL